MLPLEGIISILMKRRYSDEKIKASIMNKLLRRGCWGAKYLPLESLVHWISRRVKRDGKRIRKLINELVKEGYILVHKGGKTISLNPALSKEIIEYIEKVVKENSK